MGIKANRKSIRAPVVPEAEIKGLLTASETGEQQPFFVWDVSESGLGLLISHSLPEGTAVRITVAQPYSLMIQAVVKWCDPSHDGEGFRCGVEALEQSKKLEALYTIFKNVMEKQASAF